MDSKKSLRLNTVLKIRKPRTWSSKANKTAATPTTSSAQVIQDHPQKQLHDIEDDLQLRIASEDDHERKKHDMALAPPIHPATFAEDLVSALDKTKNDSDVAQSPNHPVTFKNRFRCPPAPPLPLPPTPHESLSAPRPQEQVSARQQQHKQPDLASQSSRRKMSRRSASSQQYSPKVLMVCVDEADSRQGLHQQNNHAPVFCDAGAGPPQQPTHEDHDENEDEDDAMHSKGAKDTLDRNHETIDESSFRQILPHRYVPDHEDQCLKDIKSWFS